jgi:uncharacterized membrane protein YqaE (UPF0057 family)
MLAIQDVIYVPAAMWTLVVSVLIPPITGFLTGLNTPTWVKSLITLLLNAVAACVATVIVSDSHAVITKSTVISTFVAYVLSHVVYKDFWKPNLITSSLVVSTAPPTDVAAPAEPAVVVQVGKLAGVGVKTKDSENLANAA